MENSDYKLTINDINTKRFKQLVKILGLTYEEIYEKCGFQSSASLRSVIAQDRISLKHILGLQERAGEKSFNLALESLERLEIAENYHLEYNNQGYMKLLVELGNKDVEIQKLTELLTELNTKELEKTKLASKTSLKENKVNRNKFPFKNYEQTAKKSY